MEGPNLALLEKIARVLLAVDKYILLGDWNCRPGDLPTSWLKSIGGRPVAPAEAFCESATGNGNVCSKVFDYAVITAGWNPMTEAKVSDELVFYPHAGVSIDMPLKMANPLIAVERSPWKYPKSLPLGPWSKPDADTKAKELSRKPPMAYPDDLQNYAGSVYQVIDEDLAAAYAVDLAATPKYGGRHREPALVKRRLIPASNGAAAASLLPHVLRLVSRKILTYCGLVRKGNRSIQQDNELASLRVRLPNIRRPGGTPCQAWLDWDLIKKDGLANTDATKMCEVAERLRKTANDIVKHTARKRAQAHDIRVKRLLKSNDTVVHSWIKAELMCKDKGASTDGSRRGQLQALASPLTNVWRSSGDDVKAQIKEMKRWHETAAEEGDNDLTLLPDTAEFTACAMSFPAAKAYSSDNIHPSQTAVLSEDAKVFCRCTKPC